MDVRTGRIYGPEEMERRMLTTFLGDPEEWQTPATTLADDHQAAFEAAMHGGHIVPVSEQVARQQAIGQRVEERRRKRKAAKAARRANRR